MRRIAGFSAAAAIAARQMVVYSEQSPILATNAAKFASPYNSWLEDWEVKRFNFTVVDNHPTQVSIEKQLELYNLDQLVTKPEVLETGTNTSYSARKPYGNKLQLELSNLAVKHGYRSKTWIGPGALRKENLQLVQNARPNVLLTKAVVTLFHVAQLKETEKAALLPVSGGSRHVYSEKSGPTFGKLSEAIALNSYKSGLFFTKRQMEQFHLELLPNQLPVQVDLPRNRGNSGYYNLSQVVNYEEVMSAWGRSEPTVNQFFLDGTEIRRSDIPTNFASKFWITVNDAHTYQLTMKPDSKPVQLFSSTHVLELMHPEQMTHPEKAYKVAGLFVSA